MERPEARMGMCRITNTPMWPTGQNQRHVATLKSLDGRMKANAAIVPAETGDGQGAVLKDL